MAVTGGKNAGANLVSGIIGHVKTFLRPFIDGTIYDTFFYRPAGDRRLYDLYQPSNGFSELKQRPTKTKRLDNYADIVRLDTTWRDLDEKMNAYFDDTVDIFPYERRAFRKEGAAAAKAPRIINPENYFKIAIATIERRFPGGGEGKIGDQDVRDMTRCLSVIYKKDLTDLIIRRRTSALQALAGMALSGVVAVGLAAFATGLYPIAGLPVSISQVTLAAAAVVAMSIFYIMHRSFLHQIKIKYESALKASAANLRNTLQPRLVELVTLIQQIMSRVNEEKWDLKGENRLDEWPEQVTRWSKLSFWLAARVEAMEDYLQVQMWLIRRIHFGLRHVAGILTFGIWTAFFCLPPLVLAVAWGVALSFPKILPVLASALPYISPGTWVVCAVSFVASALFSHLAISDAQNRNLPEIELQDILQMEEVMGHKDTRLHDAIAALIRREKISILHQEDLGGPKPR